MKLLDAKIPCDVQAYVTQFYLCFTLFTHYNLVTICIY